MGFTFGSEGCSEKLPWGADEKDPRCAEFKQKLEREIIRAYEDGARFFLSGMADGFDTYAAEAVIKLSRKRPDMRLIAVYPYGRASDARRKRIESRAWRVVSLREKYVPSCYMERNAFLVEHSSRLICGFSGDMLSGTGSTIRRARSKQLDITIITP